MVPGTSTSILLTGEYPVDIIPRQDRFEDEGVGAIHRLFNVAPVGAFTMHVLLIDAWV